MYQKIRKGLFLMKIITEKDAATIVCKRKNNSFKGTYGRVLTVGGTENFGGAITMSTSAAAHAGAGLVTCATNKENLPALHTIVPEAMFINYFDKVALSNAVAQSDITVVGPGLGTSPRSREIFQIVLNNIAPDHCVLIDGSAITLLAGDQALQKLVPKQNVIYTPHQMEWQLLSGIQIPDQSLEESLAAQRNIGGTIVLKKFHTWILHEDGSQSELHCGGPYMATGGMGDTLTGIIAAFVVQFKDQPFNQVIDAAVYTHSAIADWLSAKRYVVLPSNIISHLQEFMHGLSTK